MREVRAPGDRALNKSRAKAAGRTTLNGAEPQLIVSDIAASCEFFTSKLGFAVAFSYGEPPFYAQVHRDAARLNLRQLEEPPLDSEFRERQQVLSATITLEDAEPLFLEYQTAGVGLGRRSGASRGGRARSPCETPTST